MLKCPQIKANIEDYTKGVGSRHHLWFYRWTCAGFEHVLIVLQSQLSEKATLEALGLYNCRLAQPKLELELEFVLV